MIKVEIDRAKWDRGPGALGYLLDERGCRCALGFVAKACGVLDADILRVPQPDGYRFCSAESSWPTGILTVSEGEEGFFERALTRPAALIINANDSKRDDAWIEAEITRLGAEAGIEFTFTGEGKP